jgi:SAM-dependent methyltransferase
MDARDITVAERFDVVFSNAALHWVVDHRPVLRGIAAALKPGGRAVILEFVPNADRVSPPIPAGFSLMMLSGTPAGDAYTLDELKAMTRDAGFNGVTSHGLPTPETVVIATK